MTAIERARAAARKVQEFLYYEGRCTVKEYQEYTDPRTHLTRTQEVTVLENEPCKLSFETLTAADQTDTVATIAQGVKLFVRPDVTISPGATITVTQHGQATIYSCSGQPAVYPTHQEIILSLYDPYA